MRPTSPQACQHEYGNHHSVPSPHQLTHARRRRQIKRARKALPDNVCRGTFHQHMLLVPDRATVKRCAAAVLPVCICKPAGLHWQRVRSQAEPLNSAQLRRRQIQLPALASLSPARARPTLPESIVPSLHRGCVSDGVGTGIGGGCAEARLSSGSHLIRTPVEKHPAY